jgi:AcrR family transcriptional regulator
MSKSEQDARRTKVFQAARWCFLNFGYAKTSIQDIGKRANISRTLLYRMFDNKEDIFRGAFEDWFQERYPAAEDAVNATGSRADRLLQVCDLLLLEPWAEMVGAPMASEFYEVCERLAPALEAKHQKTFLKVVQAIIEDKEAAEVFLLALDGLHADMPATKVLRRRLELLVDRFVRTGQRAK